MFNASIIAKASVSASPGGYRNPFSSSITTSSDPCLFAATGTHPVAIAFCRLRESWVLVNTSVCECLPVSFLEAAAHSCAILSPHDPDGFATRFGNNVVDGGYASGLRWLLEGNWSEAG